MWLVWGLAVCSALQAPPPSPRGRRGVDQCAVDDYVGNQHGGKYNFDGRRDAQAVAAADYSSGPSMELGREVTGIDALLDAVDGSRARNVARFDGGVATVRVGNDEPTWVAFKARIVGPGAAAFAVRQSDGTLAPRRGVDLEVTRIGATDEWAAIAVATEEGDCVVWRLDDGWTRV